ncbi:MAG: putative leader peptide [Mycobacteriales bacterium]
MAWVTSPVPSRRVQLIALAPILWDAEPVRSLGVTPVFLVSRRHVDLQRVDSAVCPG